MIIGINGKMGSGKDTVGKMIQKIMYEHRPDKGAFSEWNIKKFGGKLKEVAGLLTGINPSSFESQTFKQKKMPKIWGDMTYREFLQKIGTDGLRNNVHLNVWVNALFADYYRTYNVYDLHGKLVLPAVPKKWIITDVRFPNEAEAIKEREGIVIRVNRFRIADENEVFLHESETALDEWKFDYEINNDGTLEELEEKVRKMLVDLNFTSEEN
jgi:hypothetical protein